MRSRLRLLLQRCLQVAGKKLFTAIYHDSYPQLAVFVAPVVLWRSLRVRGLRGNRK